MDIIRHLFFQYRQLLSLLIQDYFAQKKRLKTQSLAIKISAVRWGFDRCAERRGRRYAIDYLPQRSPAALY